MQSKCKVQNEMYCKLCIQLKSQGCSTKVQLQQLNSEIGAEWERSQWNYLYDLVTTSSPSLVL